MRLGNKGRLLFFGLLVFCALILLGAIGLEWKIRTAEIPSGLLEDPLNQNGATPVIMDRWGDPLAVQPTDLARVCLPKPLKELGPHLPATTTTIEDHRFYQHPGVDVIATTGAFLRNVRNLRVISGASTITQQLIKISSPPCPRDLRAKWRESFAAMKLERMWTKDQILEAYLNRLDYGNRRFGSEAAAQAYFGKTARDLTFSEAVFLAGLPQSPVRLNPWKNLPASSRRYQRNIERLVDQSWCPPGWDPAVAMKGSPPVGNFAPPSAARYFVGEIRKRGQGKASVRTSLDPKIQAAVESLLEGHLQSIGALGIGDAAVVVLDNATGEVRAMACAGTAAHADINSTVQPRSAGSTLKPLLYALAIEDRAFTAASLLPDTPDAITVEYRDYDPQNYSGRYFGPVRLREALGNSLNVPAVSVLSRLGARESFLRLQGWGLNFPGGFDDYGAGFILGNASVSLLDLAGAYASLARGGMAWKPRLTPTDPITSREVVSPETCAIVADMLADNNARLLSFGNNSPLHLSQRTAVKTGTSSGFRDGWCVGFNADHTVAVWAGNLDGRPMSEVLAVKSTAPLWASIMQYLYAQGDRPLPTPAESPALRNVRIAAETGLLPREGERTVEEWFLAGTEPTLSAESFYENGRLALPEEYAAWCASPHNRLNAIARTRGLNILFPRDGAVFSLNSRLSEDRQRIFPVSNDPGCRWFLNGRQVEAGGIPLSTGTWKLEARSGEETAAVQFTVE